MSGKLVVNIALGRDGGPGAEWRAIALATQEGGLGLRRLETPSTSSPGEALEAVGQWLDEAEAAAIVEARRGEARIGDTRPGFGGRE